MKKKRFQWLSNLRKFVRNNLCWRIRKKNERKQEIDDIEIKSLQEASLYSQQISVPLSPQPYISQSATVSSEFRESLYKDIFSLENDDSLLILLTKRNVRQLSFPGVRLETLPVIPLPWVKKLSDIREGSILEFQMELPMTTRYVDLERSWMTSRSLECFWGSYPSLLSKMQIVPYERQRSSWYLELASGEAHGQNAPFSTARPETSVSTDDIPVGDMEIKDSRIFTNNAKSGETFADIPPLPVIPIPWVKKLSDIREGSILEFEMELPMTTIYVDLERSWMTFWGSYPSLLSKMQIVKYECQRSSWYLELASGEPQGRNAPFSTARAETSVSTEDIPVGDMEIKDSRIFTNNSKSGETFADISPLPVIPLPWVKKLSDIREGSILEFQMELPMTTRYVDLVRSWMTFWGSYPSLLSKMQIVPYERQKSSWYLELASGEAHGQNAPFSTARPETSVSTDIIPVGDMEIKDSRIFTHNARSGETFADTPPLPVIPLPWVKKLSDIREGGILEFQMELPMTTRYVDLVRSWMTFWGSYPFLLSKMQIVPYERQRSSWYLELTSGEPQGQNAPFSTPRPETSVSTENIPVGDMEIKDSRIFTNNAKSGETFADITPLHTIRAPFGPDHLKSRLPSTDTLEVNWSVNDVNIKAIHLTSLLAEDGDYKKLYKGHNGDIKFVVTVYRRVPKKLDMNDLAKLKSPYLAELYGIFQYNSHRWITYVEAKYGDLHSLLRQDLQRTVFGEYEAKFVVVRLLSALAYLHRQGVVHGDIRPRKIFINNLGMPLLGGLETVTWPSNKGLVMKSPNSMKIGFVAPEVVTGFRPQAESDIFSVGCVAYFIATGSRPFSKRNELLNMKVRPKLTDTKLSLGALEFISACLQKPMRKRFHLGIGLRYVHQTDWFADMDVYEVSPRSPLIKASENYIRSCPTSKKFSIKTSLRYDSHQADDWIGQRFNEIFGSLTVAERNQWVNSLEKNRTDQQGCNLYTRRERPPCIIRHRLIDFY